MRNTMAWQNPPLVIGQTYKTAEVCENREVYVTVVDCGSLPSSGYKDITINNGHLIRPIRCYGYWNYNYRSTIPFESTDSDQIHIGVLNDVIRIRTGGKNFSDYNAIAVVYYTNGS